MHSITATEIIQKKIQMKTKVLLTVTALVLLAGCQKFGGVGKEIRFHAVTVPEPQTKTVYSGVATGTPKMERINWSENDVIRIYSDVASCNNDNTYHWADYKLTSIDNSAEPYSKAGAIDVTHPSRGGLAWDADGTYNFYSIFPAPADDPAATVRGTSGTPFACTIPAAQVGSATTVAAIASGANTTVYYPSMANAYLVAHDSKTKGNDITLDFSPAYTAFHISAGAGVAPETAKEIKSVTLTSTSTALNGAYTTYYDSGWNYSISGTGMTATFTFEGGNYTIPVGETVEFVIFALPQVLTDLTLTFTLADDTTRSLKLKYSASAGGGFINFAPCKKHYISGLLIPGSTWSVDDSTPVILREGVATDWDDELNGGISYGTGPVVNASGLDEVNVNPGAGNYYYRFSIYEPHGKTWKIKVLDPSGNMKNTVTVNRDNLPGGSSDPDSGSGELTGTIRGGNSSAPGLVEFHLTGGTGGQNCTLSFSVIVDGNEYSINSEVVRGNWGSGTWDYKYINF